MESAGRGIGLGIRCRVRSIRRAFPPAHVSSEPRTQNVRPNLRRGPYPHGEIVATRDHARAVGRECDAGHQSLVAADRPADWLAGRHIPHSERLIVAARDDAIAVRAESDAESSSCVRSAESQSTCRCRRPRDAVARRHHRTRCVCHRG